MRRVGMIERREQTALRLGQVQIDAFIRAPRQNRLLKRFPLRDRHQRQFARAADVDPHRASVVTQSRNDPLSRRIVQLHQSHGHQRAPTISVPSTRLGRPASPSPRNSAGNSASGIS